ncbi:hypothetical protein [Paenibacillus agilis]|uniref:DUF5050 domain-containing protein n=1 Tax=Paenibacillus agilis TaxID=3020863 RepID=A0A559IKN0_9BACL|nr:hypothetical protein [Paenibacillus agilis]TVX88167.1 hypothetical protein FPZ44_19875 [Paenibacillus agilis]
MKRSLGVSVMLLVFLTACTNTKAPELQSWAYYVVTWNNGVYKITDEKVTEIEEEIGTINIYSTNESGEISNLFSNKYKEGTKLYKIADLDTNEHIAVLDNGIYYRSDRLVGMKTSP